MKVHTCLAILSVAAASAGPILAQTGSASDELAVRLADRLKTLGRDAIAAEMPGEPGRFAAALYIPGAQLLVVSAKTPSIAAVAQHVASAAHREVYSDLQGTPTPAGKFFVVDAGADGIREADPNHGQVDLVYQDGTRMTMFNGDPRGQKLQPAAYRQVLAESDARYARILNVLLAAAGRALPVERDAPSAVAGR